MIDKWKNCYQQKIIFFLLQTVVYYIRFSKSFFVWSSNMTWQVTWSLKDRESLANWSNLTKNIELCKAKNMSEINLSTETYFYIWIHKKTVFKLNDFNIFILCGWAERLSEEVGIFTTRDFHNAERRFVRLTASNTFLSFKTRELKFRIRTPHINAKKDTKEIFESLSFGWDMGLF